MDDGHRFEVASIEKLARGIEELVDGEDPARIVGADLAKLVARMPSEEQVTPGVAVRLALLNDALRVAERAIRLDGHISDSETTYVEPLVRETQKYLGRFRKVYQEESAAQSVAHFIEQHATDTQKFGGRCRTTEWIGVAVCKQAAELAGDPQFVDAYRDVVVRMLDDLFNGVGSGSEAQKRQIVDELTTRLPPSKPVRDPREAAYCAPSSSEVFHAVAHGAEVFEPDPFDIETIHAEARTAFLRLVHRASEAKFGKMLLVKGVAGSGKTHLMRAFRSQVHRERLGFVGYLQMSTSASNYARYILGNLVTSWDRPYWGDAVPESALSCLSDAVVGDVPGDDQAQLRDDGLAELDTDAVVNRAADALLRQKKYDGLHVDVLRMMLYLQRRDPARRTRVLKFLRCESLNPHDRKYVGDVAPFEGDEGPARMLSELGNLVSATGNGALVLLVDQLEDVYNLDEAPSRFRLAIDALRHVTDHVPTSVIVLACLDDFYVKLRTALAAPVLERLERDPEPVVLTAGRSLTEIEELISRRLQFLFDRAGVRVREEQPLFPFRHEQLEARVNQRTRDVLDWCRLHHDASVRANQITTPRDAQPSEPPERPSTLDLDQAWNDASAQPDDAPDDDDAKMNLFAWVIENAAQELDPAVSAHARADRAYVDATLAGKVLVAALCDKDTRGGGLGKQLDALVDRSNKQHSASIVLRSSEYPAPGKSKVAQALKGIIQSGGRRCVVTDSDWRRMQAFRMFSEKWRTDLRFDRWRKDQRPLSGVGAVKEILEFVEPDSAAPASVRAATSRQVPPRPPAQPSVSPRTPVVSRPPSAGFSIGSTRGLTPQPVAVSPKSFVTHGAFLGSSGSGKTTLALNIIEQLLIQGTPVLMVDRKGDLCNYASPDFWSAPSNDASAAGVKQSLQVHVDVRIFTPGEPRGRPLDLPVVPTGLGDLPAHERGIAARYAASALGAMMGYRKSKSDETRLGILGKAIELVGQSRSTEPLGIEQLVSVLHEEDPDLISSVGKLDPRHFHALVENLETLRLRYEHVLRHESERLSPELLFGLDGSPGDRTRLSILSTKFLGDNAAIDFWIARLLGELSRWASRHPADGLQAVVFLDEADIYLPAQSKPATKEPMLDLLKRARSAGLGVFLATQSPGDLDYRCRDNIRTWFVGRVAEKTAVEKMKPLLSEYRVNVAAKLASAKVGEFFKLQDGDVVEFRAAPSVMKTVQLAEDVILGLAKRP